MNVPFEIRFLLAAAGLLLPRSVRLEWSREWLAEFSHAFRGHVQRRGMFTRAAGAVPDAWTLLQECGIKRRLSEAAHSRVTAVVLPALVLFALTLGTHEFQRGRDFLFQAESEDTVLLFQPVPFMGFRGSVPIAQVQHWLRTGRTAASLERGGMVAKLRAGATPREAETELAETARFQKGWQKPRVVTLASVHRAPLLPVGSVLVFLFIWSALSIRVRSAQAALWAFTPIALYFGTLGGAWLELVARAPATETALILYVLPTVLGSVSAWWFRRSAPHRCRMCYRPLMTAVSVGMEGRCIFEPGGSEYLCAEGHGALVVGLAAQNGAGRVWTSWSGSWA